MRNAMKALLVVVCAFAIVGSASATMKGDVLMIPKTQVAPVLDGQMDGVWFNAGETYMLGSVGTAPDDWFDVFTTFRLMWDADFIYGFFWAQDQVLDSNHANSWERDSFEVYFDGDNSKGTAYDGVDDIQLRLQYNGTTSAEWETGFGNAGASWAFVKDGIENVNRDFDNGLGWTSEWKIPWANLLIDATPGTQFGLEFQYNDNDGANRESNMKWWLQSGSDDSWFNPSIFGTAELDKREISEILDTWKSNGFVPTIDGTQEAGWLDFPEFTDNTYCMDTAGAFDETTVDDWTDARFHFWTIWDDSKVYTFVKVWDDIPMYDATSGNSYESDGMEYYFDGDNSKGETYDGVNDLQGRFERKDVDVADTDAQSWFDKTSIEFVNLDTDMGWNLEFSIPLANLFIDNTEGTVYGFELQMNDCDTGARDDMRRWWSWDNLSWANASKFGEAELVKFGGRTAVESQNPGVVKNYSLAQNYPNPFNPTTTIAYNLKSSGKVRLAVYDLMGKEVAVLVDGLQTAGSYDVQFAGTNLTSGIYFYKLVAGNQVFTQKMTLVK